MTYGASVAVATLVKLDPMAKIHSGVLLKAQPIRSGPHGVI